MQSQAVRVYRTPGLYDCFISDCLQTTYSISVMRQVLLSGKNWSGWCLLSKDELNTKKPLKLNIQVRKHSSKSVQCLVQTPTNRKWLGNVYKGASTSNLPITCCEFWLAETGAKMAFGINMNKIHLAERLIQWRGKDTDHEKSLIIAVHNHQSLITIVPKKH